MGIETRRLFIELIGDDDEAHFVKTQDKGDLDPDDRGVFAHVEVHGRQIDLGIFPDEGAAIRAAEEARLVFSYFSKRAADRAMTK